jgi:co-chaperonin GroES (HSP10)
MDRATGSYSMKYKPRNDNVIVLVDRRERIVNGIVQPAGARTYGKDLIVGIVVAAGPGTKDWGVDVHVGETVLIKDDAGELVVVGQDISPECAPDYEAGTEFRVVRNEEIVAVLPELTWPVPGLHCPEEP